jgi:hypothetical protein
MYLNFIGYYDSSLESDGQSLIIESHSVGAVHSLEKIFNNLLTSDVEEVSNRAVFSQEMAARTFVPTAVFPPNGTEVQKPVT